MVSFAPSPPITLESFYRPAPPRFSADSKLLAAGGFLAATMLVVAFGVWRASEPPPAASSVAFPVVVEAHPVHAAAFRAPPPVSVLPAAASPAMAGGASITLDLDHGPTVDVQSLPHASRPRARAWIAPPPHSALVAPSSAGWIAAPAQAKAVAPAAAKAAPEANNAEEGTTDTAASAEAVAPAVAPTTTASAAAPATTVDSFVQAVRDDIHEDETRTGK